MIDSDFRGTGLILMTSNSKDPILIKAGQRIAQIVFHRKEEVIVWVQQMRSWRFCFNRDLIFCNFFLVFQKMSAQEVEYVKAIFFFWVVKIIENIHSIGYWFCICLQYSGCQLRKDFIKGQKIYCCICQFQDSFNLWELNEIKRKVNKFKKYYMDIMVAVCEIKKVTACGNNFWWRDIE